MKRFLSLLLCLIFVFLLTACGEKPEESVQYDVGFFLNFGSYSKSEELEPEPLKWKIIAEESGIVLLVCTSPVAFMKFFDNTADRGWENSPIRHFLNNEFFETAFTEEEKDRIYPRTIITEGDVGIANASTHDRVFLLSEEEVIKYFPSELERNEISGWCRSYGGRTHIEHGRIYTISYTNDFEYEILYGADVYPAMWTKVK